jgi:UDP-N-acetyl-2-amino-2-deoxyglucuronate dehydrogenase
MSSDGLRPTRFALMGAAGFVARRHLEAIRSVGGELIAAFDLNDSVGILDSYFPTAQFFLDQDRFVDFLRQSYGRVDYVAVCTPSDLHERHCQLALSLGADVVLEKPPTLDPDGILRLREAEVRHARRVYPVLQLRYHPAIIAFREEVERRCVSGRPLEIEARYVARRGPWYQTSWKGDARRSGTIAYNFGIHLFDALTWVFHSAEAVVQEAHIQPDGMRSEGVIRFPDATVRWLVSSRAEDLPKANDSGSACRQLSIDGEIVADFSDDYSTLHRGLYREVVTGRSPRIADAYGATVLANDVLQTALGDRMPIFGGV